MNKILFLVFILVGLQMQSHAQVIVNGIVYDSTTKAPIFSATIENMTTHQGSFSNVKGEFRIEASLGDYIVFTHVGYARRVISIKVTDNISELKVYMSTKATSLKEVTIKLGPTEYQLDSAKRASLYDRAFDYQQQKSVFSPISSVYQKFSKKYKNLRKFQDQIVDMEQEKFIDNRYKPELVNSLTKLEDEELASFMNQYPMEYDYARVASELEIKMWIKYNFQDYIKRGKPAFVPPTKKK